MPRKKLRLREAKKLAPSLIFKSQRWNINAFDSKAFAFPPEHGIPPTQVLCLGVSLPLGNTSSPWLCNISTKEWLFTETILTFCKLRTWQKPQKFTKLRNISVHVFKTLRLKGSTLILPTISCLKRKITSSFIYWNCLEAEVRKSPSLICGIYETVIPKEQNLFCFILWIVQYFFILP